MERDPVVLLTYGVSLLLAAVVATVGALVLGEYEFTGAMPFVAGPLFGFVIGELVVALARRRRWGLAWSAAMLTAAALGVAGWIDADRGVEPIGGLVWVSVALGAVTTLARVAPLDKVRTTTRDRASRRDAR